MEINEANLTELLGHLQKTLSPDGATRKSGNIASKHSYVSTCNIPKITVCLQLKSALKALKENKTIPCYC